MTESSSFFPSLFSAHFARKMTQTGRTTSCSVAVQKDSNQLFLINIYRILYFIKVEYIFLSSAPGMFTQDHIFGYKNCNKCKRAEMIQNMFSDHNEIKPEISNERYLEKSPDTEKLNHILLNNPWAKEDIIKKLEKI